MDILFVISHVPNPRINKRIQVAKKVGEVGLIYWDRETVDIWDLQHLDIKNFKINISAEYTNPLKRIYPTLKFTIKALKQILKLKPKKIYVGNMDMLFIANLYYLFSNFKPEIIYEIADLNKLLVEKQKGLIKKVIRKALINFEVLLTKKISTLVVTSERFYTDHYKKFVPENKVLFMPNMPNLSVFKNYKKKSTEDFTIGFIGAIRYKNQMKMLIKLAEDIGIKLVFAGAGLDDEIEKLVRDKHFVKYIGKYNYEKEIANLYGQVDAIYSVYDADLKNVRVALPNKLYEAIYCEIPIIVAKDTYLSDIVEREGVGVSVKHNSQKQLNNEIIKLSSDVEYYNTFVRACVKAKEKVNITAYNEKLLKRLSN